MLRPRIIPCLLIHKNGLVKTQGFKSPKYIGDPINAVKIFNEKEADELIVLDIDASVNNVEPNYKLIAKLAAECRMPLCYGGGIKNAEQASRIIDLGVEKISISSAAISEPTLIRRISDAIGRQSVVAVLDIKKKTGFFQRGYELCSDNASKVHKIDPILFAKTLQEQGAGEIVINSVERDGEMKGYDLELAKQMRSSLNIPITFLGGAGSHQDIIELINVCGVVGAAAGSLFVFKGKYRAVLINYPTISQKDDIFYSGLSI
ncbi:imidazole glycerol phosphate synthase subunit HisF [Xenorhabdus sp. DI]|uniref:AglZ/HisF2 family acetamidino modification protein n=1 Tax=Xenorhabdus doucetiae TaxID=351671 RepID=UPI0019C8FBD9|nr:MULTISPECIES: AglZ/HisF2 family acetamidino modification protein [unclassified Xenorhabdus]MBD2785774.1 imidazole glycerol phosphate synthase subunit HisF [Xenorhabdus sp. 3]MBD2789163.1 imidazole glycerol phosphate synthase subunit HisF [Xenorhabdus sp. DI]